MTVGFLLLGFIVPTGARAQAPQDAPPEGSSAAFGRSRETGVLSVSFSVAGNANASNGTAPTTAGVGGSALGGTSTTGIPDLASSSSLAGVASFNGFRVHSEARASFNYNPPPSGRFAFQFGSSSGFRKYDTKGFQPIGDSAFVGGSLGLGSRTTISLSESFTYSPNYRLMSVPTTTDTAATQAPTDGSQASSGPALSASDSAGSATNDSAVSASDASQLSSNYDMALTANPMYSFSTSVAAKHAFAEHSSLNLTYTNQRSRFLNGIGPGLDLQNIRGQFRQQLTSWATLHMGYGRREARYGLAVGDRPTSADDIDFGIDNSRRVSFGKRTTVSFGSGTALTGRGARKFHVTGNVALDYALFQRTHVSLIANRSLRMEIGLTTPAVTTGFTATLTSKPSRTLQFVASGAMYTSSQVGSSGSSGRYHTYTANARATWQLRRSVDAYAQYLYSSHDAGSAVELISTVPHQQSRQALMIGVTMTIRKALLHSRR